MGSSIDGIISGMNTSDMIDAIIKAESTRIDLVTARQTEETNKLTSWKSIEALLVGLKAQASLLSDERLWYAKSVTSSDDDVISVSANTKATPGTYFLTVDQLASNHQIASQGISSLTQNFGSGTFEIQIGNGAPTVITVDNSNNTLTSLKDAINNSGAGVVAAVVNDGSEFNPYRLVLTAKESGEAGRISVNSNLSGDTIPLFSSQFDLAEKLSWDNNATANPIRSANASYTSNINKTYTFTVGGTGDQLIGSGDIELNWTDGTNSGTITVSAADTDITLEGDGADGLSVYFSAGTLVAGDTFQIQAFAPTIQNGQDAIVRLGSSENGGSPILFTSSENSISDLIEGVTLDLNSVSSQSVRIQISEDRSKIKDQINQFVSKYNEYQDFVNKQFSYSAESGEAGVLLGDTSLMLLQNDIRSALSNSISGLPDDMRRLSQAGIKFTSAGKLSFDESVFDKKIEENFTDLMNLFKSSGATNNAKIEYVSSNASTKISTTGYDVNITQAATRGMFTGLAIANPGTTPLILDNTNNIIRLTLNNIESTDIRLAERTYNSGAELAQELEDKINSDTNVSGIGVEVEWVDTGETGHLVIHSNTYGETSKISMDATPSNSAHNILGLAGGTAANGQNVEGTINGEKATGLGQYLTGDNGNENTAGLKLLVTLTPDELVDGSEGSVYFNKGVADIINDKLYKYTDPYEGTLQSKKSAYEKKIQSYADQITEIQAMLDRKRQSLYEQFSAMEDALGQLQSQQQYLTAALSNLGQFSSSKSSNGLTS